MTVVTRPDLSKRTALSKSVLTQFDLCQTKSWFAIHDPRPFVANEKVTFGSAVDAAVEVIVMAAAKGHRPDLDAATAAAEYIIERDGVEVDILDVQAAIGSFCAVVLPNFDWTNTATQADISATIDDLGECNGHPDIILGDGRVYDVKTSGRAKEVPSLELGFYALLVEATGGTVPAVGYINYVRVKRPFWQVVEVPVDDELRRWSMERSRAYVRARKADERINANNPAPQNYSFPGGAKFDALCSDCPYNPALGGPCSMVLMKEASDDFAA
jgi:CRISPR/Cas system-associated exonuclease Cas4 (RecB family)